MARIRTIKPEFFQSEDMASCSPHARLLAIALLQLCDSQGVFRNIPMQIHAHAFPWEAEVNSPALLRELEGIGYVKFYRVEGKEYGFIEGFKTHQRLSGKEAQSGGMYPGPDQADQGEEGREKKGKQQGASQGSTQVPRKGKGKEESNTSGENLPPSNVKFTDDDLKTAQFFFDSILKTQPDFKKPNLESWADTVRLMREQDNRTHADICRVWLWARNDTFWQPNILSAKKLREKYDHLKARMGTTQQPDNKKPRSLADVVAEQERNRGL